MATTDKDNSNKPGTHEHPLPQQVAATDKATTDAAHEQADHDIAEDPDFAAPTPNDDLDEGETARLGEEGNPIE